MPSSPTKLVHIQVQRPIFNFTRWLRVHLSKVGVRLMHSQASLTNQNKELLLNEDGEYTERAKENYRQDTYGEIL